MNTETLKRANKLKEEIQDLKNRLSSMKRILYPHNGCDLTIIKDSDGGIVRLDESLSEEERRDIAKYVYILLNTKYNQRLKELEAL